ncbi:acid protease [Lophiostoma macrostomum CBS 122681]|uniref:Acid protease n=1 Tax=Lophiostoma macrostomum CBS 122681 TaxID=1314788 RepID=A0A6A6T9U9_9PLEO|nr:acid protease [Lophiostoma macrostomum CBS 122681]
MMLPTIVLLCLSGPAFAGAVTRQARSYEQEVLEVVEPKRYAIPVQSADGVIHTINITLGTPPQHFNVSLSFDMPGFFVKTADIDDDPYYLPVHRYNSSLSKTYQFNGTSASDWYWGISYYGLVVEDTVGVGDLTIRNVTFNAYNTSRIHYPLAWEVGFDGGLGLSPPWHGDDTCYYRRYPSFLEHLTSSGALDDNVFSLKLPRSLGDEGELMLGGPNPDLYNGDIHRVPALHECQVDNQDVWKFDIEAVTFNSSVPVQADLSNYTAVIISEPMLVLPSDFVSIIREGIGAEPINVVWDSIPCDRRPYLPELTFTIGGRNFTIDAYDYTFEYPVGFGYAPICLLWVIEDDEMGGEGMQVMLGTPFLKGLYTTFDMDNEEIGFAELKR